MSAGSPKRQQKTGKSKSFQVFQSNKFNLNDQFLPRIKKQKLVSKNPFLVKKVRPLPLIYERGEKELNGFLVMKVSKAVHPEEVECVDLNGLNLTSVNQEHLILFKNLRELDVGMNQLCFQDLACFPGLKHLHFQGNMLHSIDLSTDTPQFPCLQILDISYNRIQVEHLLLLATLPQLKELNISANDIQTLPSGLDSLHSLECLNLSSNLLNSKKAASDNWEVLATLRQLRSLDVSRNQLRGIHTEKLKAGDFLKLEHLDISYNVVDNQYNLICSRNFPSLKTLDITANPFATQQQHKGLEMEVMARTGAQVINQHVPKPYLRNQPPLIKPSIAFNNILKLQDQYIKKGDKTYFFGCNLATFKDYQDSNDQKEDKQEEEEEEVEEQKEDEEKFFLTEDVKTKEKREKKEKKEEEEDRQLVEDKKWLQQEVKMFNRALNKDYQSFKTITAQLIASHKDYEDPIEIASSYKILAQILRKPNLVQLNDNKPKNYEKNTISLTNHRLPDESKTILNITQQHQSKTFIKATEQQSVQQILEQLNKKLKQDIG